MSLEDDLVLLPIGALVPFKPDEVPVGWLICDGREVSREAYQELSEAAPLINQSWVRAHGSSQFLVEVGDDLKVPDFIGREYELMTGTKSETVTDMVLALKAK